MRIMLVLALALAGCGAATPAARPARTRVAPDAAPLLDAWAAALGGRARLAKVALLHEQGRVESGGLDGPFDVWERADGARREEVDLGGVERWTQVFDGGKGWLVDRNRKVRELDGPEVDDQVALGFLAAQGALFLERRAGAVERDGETLRLLPEGGRPLTVTFDPATHLPATIARPDAEKTRVLTLSDWREVDGVKVPFAVREEDGDPRDTRAYRVERAELDGAAPVFGRPADGPPDVHFAAAGPVELPISLGNSLIFVQVGVGSSAPLSFVFDTGAEVTVINASRLARLGLQPVGKLSVGAGGGNAELSYVKDVSFTLPGVTVTGQIIAAIPLDALEGPLGRPIDGVLGYDFTSRFIVEIDYEKKKMRLYDPATFRYAGRGEAVPILLAGSTPAVRASVELAGRPPLAAHFTVDTGCTCEVSFYAPFARVNRLREGLAKVLDPPRGSSFGAGGETHSVSGRIAGLSLGAAKVASPVADFAEDTTGAMADPDSAGLVGGAVLKRFIVTLDYSRKTMWLEKNTRFAEPTRFVAAGIMWAGTKDGYAVGGLVAAAPGAEAGLAVGDVLVSVDGKPAKGMARDDLEGCFHEGGKTVTTVVRRGGKELTVKVTPRELL